MAASTPAQGHGIHKAMGRRMCWLPLACQGKPRIVYTACECCSPQEGRWTGNLGSRELSVLEIGVVCMVPYKDQLWLASKGLVERSTLQDTGMMTKAHVAQSVRTILGEEHCHTYFSSVSSNCENKSAGMAMENGTSFCRHSTFLTWFQ